MFRPPAAALMGVLVHTWSQGCGGGCRMALWMVNARDRAGRFVEPSLGPPAPHRTLCIWCYGDGLLRLSGMWRFSGVHAAFQPGSCQAIAQAGQRDTTSHTVACDRHPWPAGGRTQLREHCCCHRIDMSSPVSFRMLEVQPYPARFGVRAKGSLH